MSSFSENLKVLREENLHMKHIEVILSPETIVQYHISMHVHQDYIHNIKHPFRNNLECYTLSLTWASIDNTLQLII